MNVRHISVDVTTSTAGTFTNANLRPPGSIFLQAVYRTGSTVTKISALADLLITENEGGMVLLSATDFGSTAGFTKLPRRFINNAADGVESTAVSDYMVVDSKITMAITGATASGQRAFIDLYFGG